MQAEMVSFFAQFSHKSQAQHNTITGKGSFSGYGIGITDSNDAMITQNTITAVDYGIIGFRTDRLHVESNSVTNASEFGIQLDNTIRATIRKNITNFAVYGVFIATSTNTTISDNTAKGNDQSGMYADRDSTGNTFKKNLLQGNGADAVDNSTGSKTAGTANTWLGNKCDVSVPDDLCSSPATE